MLERTSGVVLQEPVSGVARACVSDPAARLDLRWDRYIRLSACAEALRALVHAGKPVAILDVGGFDGALALFLPDYDIYVLDPATTSGDTAALPSEAYDFVVAIDVIEHIEPRRRSVFIAQLARLAKTACVVNYPLPASSTTQKIVAAVTGDPLVIEHVKFGLPYTATVQSQFEGIGFDCHARQYASRSLWATIMALCSVDKSMGASIGRYLIEEHERDRYPDPLYELLVAKRRR